MRAAPTLRGALRPTMPEEREHVVTAAEAGRRLDRVLADCWADLSRTRLQRLMETGRVHIGGRPVRARDLAAAGARVVVTVPDAEPSRLTAEEIPLAVVYEDEHLLVIDKPPGLVVHPGAGVRTGTLAHALLHHAPEIAGVGGPGRPGIVHRLDRHTSGLLLVAKTEASYLRLVAAIARREVARTYQALVWGQPRLAGGRVEAPIGRHPGNRKRMAVTPRGRPAATRFRLLESFGWASHLECELETGRTHQIRVHLSHLGHPVLADSAYGGGPRRALNLPQEVRRLAGAVFAVLPRQALHAARLEFCHPLSAGVLRLEAPPPADFAAALELLRRSMRGGMQPCREHGRRRARPQAERTGEVRMADPRPERPEVITLSIPSRLDLLILVDQVTNSISGRLGFTEEERTAISLSVVEAGTNAIQHGHHHDGFTPVVLRYELLSDRLTVSVRDSGEGFTPPATEIDMTTPEHLLDQRGRGIFIMRACMDRVEFSFSGGGTIVSMVKHTRAAPNGSDPHGS